jgi:hypothetical protein
MNYIWPLSQSATPDEMNTSFGPRIDDDMRDFHDGIDLPALKGTNVYAVYDCTIYLAGPKDDHYSSRHVVLQCSDPNGLMYVAYFHLNTIAPGIVTGATNISQGALLGTVGDDGAAYPHLHIEFRKGSNHEVNSVHPLGYLPYSDTPNFTSPVVDRFNRLGALMAARLLFTANSRLEGDLRRVEVDLKNSATLLQTRVADFNDKTTVNEGNSDEYIYQNDIGVEGYQKSQVQNELKYGVMVRNIPANCDTLVARVIDVGNNTVTSSPITVPNQTLTDISVDFEDSQIPPDGWTIFITPQSSGTVTNDVSAAHSPSLRGMRCNSPVAGTIRIAAIDHVLPAGRFEWNIEGWFKPTISNLADTKSVYLLQFLNGTTFSAAARIRLDPKNQNSLLAGIAYQNLNNESKGSDSSAVISTGIWRKWRLSLLRIATRETTAVLYLDDVEQTRICWDSTGAEPVTVRAGVARISGGVTATMLVDDIRLTESAL